MDIKQVLENMDKNISARHKAKKLFANCYSCHHQSAIIGCDYRFDGRCDGKSHFKPRRKPKERTRPCDCPNGSLCEFFDKDNDACLYGKI